MLLSKQSVILAVLGLFSAAVQVTGSIYPIGKRVSGTATWYAASGYSGTCSLDDMAVSYNGTAMSSDTWFGANICGACLKVFDKKTGKSTKVIVSNQCPNCGTNHLDLDPKAFQLLAPTSQGVINPVEWEIIPCGFKQPVSYHFKDGVSQWWFAIQVLYHNVPIVKLEVSIDNGKTWTKVQRLDYNYFVYAPGFGNHPLTVRITGENGQKLVDHGLVAASGAIVKGKRNFSTKTAKRRSMEEDN